MALGASGGGARCDTPLRAARAVDGAAQASGMPDVEEQAPARQAVLVIDDEPEVASVLAEIARAQGFSCNVANGGAEAREALERRDYDAILCDLHMPGTDGAAVFAWLKAHKPRLCDRVAFVTADTLGSYARSLLEGSGRPVLDKPFLPREVRQVLRALAAAEPVGEPGDR